MHEYRIKMVQCDHKKPHHSESEKLRSCRRQDTRRLAQDSSSSKILARMRRLRVRYSGQFRLIDSSVVARRSKVAVEQEGSCSTAIGIGQTTSTPSRRQVIPCPWANERPKMCTLPCPPPLRRNLSNLQGERCTCNCFAFIGNAFTLAPWRRHLFFS